MTEQGAVRFAGALAANNRIERYIRWRGYGTASVGGEGIEFSLGRGFRWMGNNYLKREDLARAYPVRSRRFSLSTLAAAAIPQLSNTGVRFLTRPAEGTGERDDYLFFSYRHEEWKLIDLLEELAYPVDRRAKSLRLSWENEV